MPVTPTVTAIPGDGIGPEIFAAVQAILAAAGAQLHWDEQLAGKRAFDAGVATGVPQGTLDSIARNRVALKGPLDTPIGFGGRSANVTLRKAFDTYANIRPAREMPGVEGPFAGRGIDLVVVRENVEDLYAGIEYAPTPDSAEAVKLVTERGCERIVRAAFEYARVHGYETVHCATKSNILKKSEGMLKRAAERVAVEYPDVGHEHIIVDNLAHQLVIRPERFGVLVMTNMNGDILSDLTSGLVGGLGLAPSANLGPRAAIFEAVHGSAPDIAGRGLANPTALTLSACMMLRHLDQGAVADRVEAAVRDVYAERRELTGDILGAAGVGTEQFTGAVIAQLQRHPLEQARARPTFTLPIVDGPLAELERDDMGVDLWVESTGGLDAVRAIADTLPDGLELVYIAQRGAVVFPQTGETPADGDLWRVRLRGSAAVGSLLETLPDDVRWVTLRRLDQAAGEERFSTDAGWDG